MAFEIKQSLRLSQQLVMTPQLQQAIKLLQLNRMELQELVTQEMMENPILEEVSELSESEMKEADAEVETSQDPEAEQLRDEEAFADSAASSTTEAETLVKDKNEDVDWESYIEEFSQSATSPNATSMREINEDLPSFENALTKTTSLEEHLSWQLSMVQLVPEERKFCESVIGNLSDDGYLNASAEDLAKEAGLDFEDALEVLKIIHHFDPLGCGSRDLRECLLTQASLMNPRQPLVEKIISDHLSDLERKNYSAIAKSEGVSLDKVIEATKLIMEFEPKPGRSFQSGDTQYITPDIYVYKVGNDYSIVLNEEGLPRLRISPYYRNVLQSAQIASRGGDKDGKGKETKDYVQEKLRAAIWLIRSIHNRQKTIHKVTEAIVKRQRDFFEKGVQHLKPMILKDVANDIGMHESTISRVTTNKYVHTPVGIFELKYFFNSSINAADGSDSLASEAVKEKIRQIITKEDPKSPISDQKIVELLRGDNIEIARRTVAKYRDMLGILSSAKRKKGF